MSSCALRGASRKPLFDVVRTMLGRGFTQEEVDRIDRAIDLVLGIASGYAPPRLGRISEAFESGGRGPGAVSSGRGDPGGISYGTYQLSSRAGTVRAFLAAEGARWQDEFGGAAPGSAPFTRAWRAIAQREPEEFAEAQRAFIERTHYRPAVAAAFARTGLDLDSRHAAVRDAVWSVAVQHGGAAGILVAAVERTDAKLSRSDAGYDRGLVEAIYAERARYVLDVARRSGASARQTLQSIVRNRYPAELASALAMFGESGARS